jgi:hypothetical protein
MVTLHIALPSPEHSKITSTQSETRTELNVVPSKAALLFQTMVNVIILFTKSISHKLPLPSSVRYLDKLRVYSKAVTFVHLSFECIFHKG